MEARYTIAKAAALLGVSKHTLRRWERKGKIQAPRRLMRTKERIYTDEDIQRIQQWMYVLTEPELMRKPEPARKKRA